MNLSLSDYLSVWDWVVFSFVLILTIAAVLISHHYQKTFRSERLRVLDYLIMGRQLTLPMFVATLVATWYGGIFGVTQIAFDKGIYNFVTQGVFWYVTYIIFAFFLVKKVRSFQAVTLPDLVTKLYGPRSGKLSAILNFVNVLPIAYAISIGLLLQVLLNIELWQGIVFGVLLTTAYTVVSGFRAVVVSDLVQFFVMCSSVALVAVYSIVHFGGMDYLSSKLPSTHFDPLGGETVLNTFVWGMIALATLIDPTFYQRCFSAKSDAVAKWGILLSTVVWIGFDLCTTVGGLYARAALPHASSGNAYLSYTLLLLPDGLRGFALAGFAATILSTLDGFMFIAGNTLSYDLLPARFRNRFVVHCAGFGFAAGITIVLALLFEGNIRDVWKTFGTYAAACMLFPILIGYVVPWVRRDSVFLSSCAVAILVTTIWRYSERTGIWKEIDEIYVGGLSSAVTLFVTAGLMRAYRPNHKRRT